MRSRVYETVERPSVRLSICSSVCLSRRSTAATAAGGFPAERIMGRKYRSIAARRASCGRRAACAGAQQQCAVLQADVGSVTLTADRGG